MSRKLAIKGHPTRSKEVIEILEMLGGINDRGYIGTNTWKDEYYTLDNGYIRVYDWSDDIKFTLEEFLEKYQYKVGDKVIDCYGNTVTIKTMKWSNDFETMVYDFKDSVIVLAAEDLLKYNAGPLVDKETITPTPDITANVTDKNNCDIQCPDGYEFYDESGNLIGTKVMMRPKKPVYPKTFKECRAILNYMVGSMSGYKASLLASLQDLLVCRDAYWKIAGEQMGLNKPWKPEYKALEDNTYFTIQTFNGGIDKSATSHRNAILAFPTIEMRDTFYENFKDLIEQCKDLL